MNRASLLRNITSLYGIQVASALAPLLLMPYLARALGPEQWGLVVFAQALGLWLALFLEYGFALSGTREIARAEQDPTRLAALVAGVYGARFIIGLVLLPVAAVILLMVPEFRQHPWLWVGAVSLAAAYGLDPIWFFQGIERVQHFAMVSVCGRLAGLASVFFLVHGPDDAWLVLPLQAAGIAVGTVVGAVMIAAAVPWRRPSWALSVEALTTGWSMFLFRAAASFYTTANGFLLGLLASPVAVGYYGGAERIAKGSLQLLNPISQAVLPRVSRLIHTDPQRAARSARRSLGLMVGVASAGTLLIEFSAGPLVAVFLGEGYESVIPVLRVMALLIPLIAASNVLGIQWMIPLGLDRSFNAIVISAGFLNILLAVFLASRYGALGMAASAVVTEAYVVFCMAIILVRRRAMFWRTGAEEFQPPASGKID